MSSIVRPSLFLKDFMLLRRSFRTGHSYLVSEKAYQKMKLKQAKMQLPDGDPVYLKCGTRDKVLYYLTMGLIIYSCIQSAKGLRLLLKEY